MNPGGLEKELLAFRRDLLLYARTFRRKDTDEAIKELADTTFKLFMKVAELLTALEKR